MPYLALNDLAKLGAPSSLTADIVETQATTLRASGATAGVVGSEVTAAHGSDITEHPLVKLDTETITEATAARLATSLLGHILFLKNQIPL